MPNPDLDALRERVRQLEATAQRKIARNAKKGVKLEGTKYDPLRPNAPVAQYTRIQLESYARRIEKFTHRGNQFVPGRKGVPISATQWRAYQRAERAANGASDRVIKAVKDVYVPATGMTVGQRMAATQSEFPKTANPASNDIYTKITRDSRNIVSEKALNRLIKQQREKVTPAYIRRETRNGRKQFEQMMLMAGRNDIIQSAKKLSDDQFHFLWRFTNTPGASSLAYEITMRKLAGNNARWYDQVADDSMGDVKEMVEWVGMNIPVGDEKPKAKRRKNYTNTNAGPISIYTSNKAGPIELP